MGASTTTIGEKRGLEPGQAPRHDRTWKRGVAFNDGDDRGDARGACGTTGAELDGVRQQETNLDCVRDDWSGARLRAADCAADLGCVRRIGTRQHRSPTAQGARSTGAELKLVRMPRHEGPWGIRRRCDEEAHSSPRSGAQLVV